MITDMGIEDESKFSRFKNLAVNFTNNYGACQQVILPDGD